MSSSLHGHRSYGSGCPLNYWGLGDNIMFNPPHPSYLWFWRNGFFLKICAVFHKIWICTKLNVSHISIYHYYSVLVRQLTEAADAEHVRQLKSRGCFADKVGANCFRKRTVPWWFIPSPCQQTERCPKSCHCIFIANCIVGMATLRSCRPSY